LIQYNLNRLFSFRKIEPVIHLKPRMDTDGHG
jgi:hypothetical protein